MLVGFISGIILNLNVEGKTVKVTEVNFLCVKKQYRSKSMASVLIKEVVRRSNLLGVFSGLYTSGTMLPTPICQTRYYHRTINAKKLIETGFSFLPPNQRLQTRVKLFSLPKVHSLQGDVQIKPLTIEHINQIKVLLAEYFKKFDIFT